MNRRQFLAAAAALGAACALPVPAMAAPSPGLPKGMVTLTFDDGIVSNHTYALPILRARGQVATAGIVVTRMLSGNNDYMNVEQVRDLEQNGWEIASHSLTHPRPVQIPKTYAQEPVNGWFADERQPGHFQTQYEYERIAGLYQDGKPMREAESLNELLGSPGSYWLDRAIAELHLNPLRVSDPSALDIRAGSYQREMEQSRDMLLALGFKVDTYIAPHNYWTDDVEALCRPYYAQACAGRDSDNRPASFDRFAIKRFMAHARDSAQSYIRIIKDHSLEHGGWTVFCFHGVESMIGWEPVSAATLDTISAWLASEGVPVVTLREGTRIMLEQKKNLPVPQTKSIVKKGS